MDFSTSTWDVSSAADVLSQRLFGSLGRIAKEQPLMKSTQKRKACVLKSPASDSKLKKNKKPKTDKRESDKSKQAATTQSTQSVLRKASKGPSSESCTKIKSKTKRNKLNVSQQHTDCSPFDKTDNSSATLSVTQEKLESCTNETVIESNKTFCPVSKIMENESKKKKKRKKKCKRNKFKDYTQQGQDNLAPQAMNGNVKQQGLLEKETSEEASNLENRKISRSVTESGDVSKSKKNKMLKKKKKLTDSLSNEVVVEQLQKKQTSKAKNKPSVIPVEVVNICNHPSLMKQKSPFDPIKLDAILSGSGQGTSKFTERTPSDMPKMHKNKPQDSKLEGSKPKTLLEKSKERLKAARFRFINEQLYTSTGDEAMKMFRDDQEAFNVYHEGFQSQVEKWPTNPLDLIIEFVKNRPRNHVVADFGCGDAKLARSVTHKVHSFDLVALNDMVMVCDIAKVPLKDGSVDVAVFCLSLMGTNLVSYLQEANRVLKQGAIMKVAEVTSRFHRLGHFIVEVEKMGFKLTNQDTSNKMFVMMDFKKTSNCKASTTPDIQLSPCVYKKR